MTTNLDSLDSPAEKIVSKYDRRHAAVLPLLHLAQDQLGLITPEAEAWVSKWTEVPVVHVREVVTFYSMFRQKKAGRHHIRFCTTTSCMLLGGENILQYLKKKLAIENGQTSPDGKISLEEAECLCACEMAPMMQVDGKYVGPLTTEKVDEIIEGLK